MPLQHTNSAASVPNGKYGIKVSLVAQINHAIDWDECMDQCAELSAQFALEIGSGNFLSKILRERHPQIDTRAISDFRSLAGIIKWLDKKR
jgi:[acyl-carrier-protein] S-malonyltransferase